MVTLCTLFDANYLDKGLVLYESLERCVKEFRLYTLAMDQKCLQILRDLRLSNATIISLDDFCKEEDLEILRKQRSAAEFCWTCTPHLIEYIFEQYGEVVCTYVDADICFYGDCSCLIKEMGEKAAQIVEHRFTNSVEDQIAQLQSGKYCVEFNTFRNTVEGRSLLNWWKEQCRISCSSTQNDGKVFGDQKYLEEWENDKRVAILRNEGGGVAPWNVAQYRLVKQASDDGTILIKNKKTKKEFKLIFYHFHNVSYLNLNKANISVYQRAWGVDDALIQAIYPAYLRQADKMKTLLKEKYDIQPLLSVHPSFEGRVTPDRTIKDLFRSLRTNGIRGLYVMLYLQINGKLRKYFKEDKNIISF